LFEDDLTTNQPSTELETAVSRLLATAHLAQDADIQRTENQLLAATLSPEEVVRRRNELRQMRELAFRGEVKARRVAKIKSKVYRKIARGKKERLDRAGAEGEEEDGEDAMRREVDRARERAGMRIKRNAKWNRARVEGEEEEELDGVGGRREMEIELEREERLARLIRGEKDGASSGGDDDDSGDEGGEEGIKRSAFNELKSLAEGGEGEETAKQKGVFGMKFMQDAMQRRNVEANKMADDFVAEMGLRVGEDSDEEDGDVGASGVITHRTGGRVTYRPGTEAISKTIPVRIHIPAL
jgi:U3 small nucleolar RNA-associated protein 14